MVVETIGRRLLHAAIQALRSQPPEDPIAAGAEQLDRLLPADPPFPEIWNRSLAPLCPQCKAYHRARKAREKARLRLLEAINPVSLHPAYGKEPEGMVLVPGGLYTVGPAKGWSTGEAASARTVEVGSFFIDRFEVTNRQYLQFLGSLPERKAAALYPTTWEKSPEGGAPRIPEGEEEHPVTGVDLIAAMAYAEWRGKSDPQYRNLRIPTEEEWEIAGRGPSSLLYTWGDIYSEKSANGYDSGRYAAAAVGSYPADRSPFLCFDMCGNVAEWTVSRTEGKPLKSPPPEGALLNVICRGGSFLTPEPIESTSLTYRWPQPARGTHRSDLGFRCVKDAPER
jgi:iron(II)-dependent oxidoreductase